MTGDATAQLPLSFREDEARFILECVNAGESCSLVGMVSVGKSNLVRFLQRADVLHHYLGACADSQLIVVVDGNSLPPLYPSPWGVYELILHRLLQALERREDAREIVTRFAEPCERVLLSENPLLALRTLERVLGAVTQQLHLRIALLFDEFDPIVPAFEPQFFANLRALRDEFIYDLTYITMSRQNLARLRVDAADIEPFYELLAPNVRGLRPYAPADARFMVARLATRLGVAVDATLTERLVVLSGGHSGLLRALFTSHADKPDAFRAKPLSDAGVWAECVKIWSNLGEDEQAEVHRIATNTPQTEPARGTDALLRVSGIVTSSPDSTPAIFSPVFAAFAADYFGREDTGLRIDARTGAVTCDGRAITDLTPLERRLLLKLAEEPGRLYTRKELLDHLYPDDTPPAPGVPDGRLDTLVSRLRRAIEPNPFRPRFVLTARGIGFRLVTNAE
jgi:hypothetical protein